MLLSRVPNLKTTPFRIINSNKYPLSTTKLNLYDKEGMSREKKRSLTLKTLNPQIRTMEYNAIGVLVLRADEIEKEMKRGVKKPFDEVIWSTRDDCHAVGQPPLTFVRQVLALVQYPKLLEDPQFPDDTKSRAKSLLQGCRGGSVGSYTDSPGIEMIRKHVAEYVENRDGGIRCEWQNIILTSGASEGIKNILKLMISDIQGKKTGVMVPVPQYSLYSASIAEYDLHEIPYYLDESKNWGITTPELERAISDAAEISRPQAIVVINPGSPTGQVLTRKNIEEIIKFAHDRGLFILADEVYQNNIFSAEKQFVSMKKVLREIGKPYSLIELASFMSSSKGYIGECGIRGGFTEVINLDAKVKPMYLKAISAALCPAVIGQIVTDLVVNPPKKGDPSYDLFTKEKETIYNSQKMAAKMLHQTFNSLKGFKCNPLEGGLYAFPRITFPKNALLAAETTKKSPEMFYALELLETEGVCIRPGISFGEEPGSFHFRVGILPRLSTMKTMLEKVERFHREFMGKYS